MKNFIKEYFSFSKQEQRGALLLIILILCLLTALFVSRFYQTKHRTDFSAFEAEIESFENQQKETSLNGAKKRSISKIGEQKERTNPAPLFYFDPNKTNDEDWMKLGLHEKQIQTINNYLSKGGKFRSKNDLDKIYGLDKNLLEKLKPYILIEEEKGDTKSFTVINKRNVTQFNSKPIIEINTADSTGLINLNGIGPAFAKRIIKYRDLLGGFYKKGQLLEVYGLDTVTYSLIEKQIIVDPTKVKKINLNICTLEELKKHPYFKYNLARSIINIRQQHGSFQDVSKIKQSDLVNDELYLKIAPYLVVE